MLIGREVETAQILDLIERVRGGRGDALALEGEPGAGKTVLLEDAIGRAEDMVVLKARGIQSESQISFSGLLELLRPVLGHLPELPSPQAAALAGALALGPPVGGDRFAVFAATLSLLARAAQERPVLAVVDDVHWLDPASVEAVRFAARRLNDERVGFLLAVRSEERGAFDPAGVPALAVGGLKRDASLALLPAGTATLVADEILRATAGNALALVELPSLLSPAQLEGREPLDDPLRAGARAERAFLTRVDALPASARHALLLAAASGTTAVDAILRGLDVLGLDAGALEAAESAGLIRISAGTVEFRHPLVRSTVYHAATAVDRRIAHRTLAQVLEGSRDPHAAVRRAWHLADATLGSDAGVAAQLDAAADGARRRAGYAEAAMTYERAAELTPPGDDRARRDLRAAEAWQIAGRSGRAVELIDRALPAVQDSLLRAQLHHLSGRIDIWRGPSAEATNRLVAEAERIAPVAPELAAHMLSDAVTSYIHTGPIGDAMTLARRAHAQALPVGGQVELLAALQLGKALILNGDDAGDAMALRYCELMAGDDPLHLAAELAHVLPALMTIEAFAQARTVLERLVPAARAAGAFGLLAYCLGAQAEIDMRAGRWASAYADAFEAADLAREAGQVRQLSYNLARLAGVEALQGREAAARAHADEALALSAGLGVDASTTLAQLALVSLEIGAGRYEAAADLHVHDFGMLEPNRMLWQPDHIEACVRTGRPEAAERALADFAAQVERACRPTSMGALYRCRGLVAGETDFANAFETALEWHAKGATPFERARTELCYGERLRRARRRSEARGHLRAALATFDQLGARPWAERAQNELRASGETVRTRDAASVDELTAQELQVARIVADGATNREAAAALFVTQKTVEFHLSNAYRKLGLRSRAELARRLA